MFELYKRTIGGELLAKDPQSHLMHRTVECIKRSRLFLCPEIPFIGEPKKGNDSLLSPYKYIWVEPFDKKWQREIHNAVALMQITIKELRENMARFGAEDKLISEFRNRKDDDYVCAISLFFPRNNQLGYFPIRMFVSKKGDFLGMSTYKDINESDAQFQYDVAQIVHRVCSFLRFINLPNIKIAKQLSDNKMRKYCDKQKSNQTHYHILTVVKPSKQAVSNGETHNEISMPLHQVRGHLADYTEGKGLFGKYNIRIWVPDHWRGELKYGKVSKDYKVMKLPRNEYARV